MGVNIWKPIQIKTVLNTVYMINFNVCPLHVAIRQIVSTDSLSNYYTPDK